jgi:hypothetical protein
MKEQINYLAKYSVWDSTERSMWPSIQNSTPGTVQIFLWNSVWGQSLKLLSSTVDSLRLLTEDMNNDSNN